MKNQIASTYSQITIAKFQILIMHYNKVTQLANWKQQTTTGNYKYKSLRYQIYHLKKTS
jgi:hypothetical protein